MIDAVLENPNIDIKLVQLGPISKFDIWSVKAMREFEAFVPHKIDRHNHKGLPTGNLAPESFGILRSTKGWDERRKVILRTMGINFASQYIPMIIQTVDNWARDVKFNVSLNLSNEMGKITFRIITKILFGKDIDKLGSINYVSPFDGREEKLRLEDFYSKIGYDQFRAYLSPKGKIFGFLANLNLVEPYKTNSRNIQELCKVLRNFVNVSTDKESVYQKIISLNTLDIEDVFKDMVFLLFAGFDTTSKAVSSTLYLLKKYPETMKKLKSALDTSGILKLKFDDESKLNEMYSECDYLSYVTKESLRIDPTAISGLWYMALEDITICGIPFSKGTLFAVNCLFPHFNPESWKDPCKFIPERFDPENKEYFYKPGDLNESRDPKWYIPFSVGTRNWAGQTLAKLELKVIVSRIITVIDFEIDKDQIENDYAKFNLFSQMTLSGKVTRRHLD